MCVQLLPNSMNVQIASRSFRPYQRDCQETTFMLKSKNCCHFKAAVISYLPAKITRDCQSASTWMSDLAGPVSEWKSAGVWR